MVKKYSTTTTLVIVESPAKCKKIEEILGPGYKCVASYGHLRNIVSLKNIDIENNFTPTYTIIEEAIKKKQIEYLRKEIKNASEVIISSDADREGEMIGFSIIELFKLPLNTKRIVFNEITESAIQQAIKNPRTIDMNLVNAQQARQILDILVGFKITPMLWKFISFPKGKENSLSAGRCQTPALRIIYENQKELNSNEQIKVYNTIGYFTNLNLAFELNKHYESEDEMTNFLNDNIDFSHIYTCSQPLKIFKKPPEPFTTSRIQQMASNELHYSPKETMQICQKLYEGGYITYMRTDSKTYSSEFLESIKLYIVKTFNEGEKYFGENIVNIDSSEIKETIITKKKSTKKKDIFIQEAHEAIRPTNISLLLLPEGIDLKQKKMYKLIWTNTLESCMAAASFHSITANISSIDNTKFTFISELIDFPGWKIVTKKYETENKEFNYLQKMKQNSLISYKKIYSKLTLKGIKQHYTEARLVQLLEEKGIGRPSTFSSLIDKIQERGYVKKEDIKGKEIICKDFELEKDEIFEFEVKREFGNEKNKLVIQPLGIIVMEFIIKHFNELFNYTYTSSMEETLDKISKGQQIWYDLCNTCNIQIEELMNGLKEETKFEIKIDDNNTYLVGKFGPVIKHVEKIDGKEQIEFKSIRKDIDIQLIESGHYNIDDIIDKKKIVKSQFLLGQYNGKDVIIKKGKFGLYISWGESTKTLKELGNRPIENITLEEVKKYLDEGSNVIREISSNLSIRKGPKGDYIFYKTIKMKKPLFFDIKSFIIELEKDYKICDKNILKSWIENKYNLIP